MVGEDITMAWFMERKSAEPGVPPSLLYRGSLGSYYIETFSPGNSGTQTQMMSSN